MKNLLDPFDRNKPIKELIKDIEEVHMFLMSILNEERKLPDITLVDYGIMKLKDTRLYDKAIRK